jgi:hypothetical protein
MPKIYHTTQISMPYDIKFADCLPDVVTNNFDLARAYYAGSYGPRSAWYEWSKGPFPPVFSIEYSGNGLTGSYSIYFNSFTGGSCPTFDCHLQCTNQSIYLITGDSTGTTTSFCIDGDRPIYRFNVLYETIEDKLSLPAQFAISFEDSLGNVNVNSVQSISPVKPLAPLVGVKVDESASAKAFVGISLSTEGFNKIEEDGIESFKIERCDWPSRTNKRSFVSYIDKTKNNNIYIDNDLSSGHEVAYRIRFKNKWNEESQYSDWSVGGI